MEIRIEIFIEIFIGIIIEIKMEMAEQERPVAASCCKRRSIKKIIIKKMLQEKVQFLSEALSFSAASGFFVSYFNRRCCWIVCGVSVGLNLILFAGLLYWKFFIPQPPPPGYGGYPSQGIFPLRRSSSVFMLLEKLVRSQKEKI